MKVVSAFESVARGGEIIELWPIVKGVKLRVQIARVPNRKASYESFNEETNGKN